MLSIQFSTTNTHTEEEKKKNTRHAMENVSSIYSKQGIDTVSEKAEKLDLLGKDFELIILKMFKELKESTSMVSKKTEYQ